MFIPRGHPHWIPFINDRSIIKVLDTKFPYLFTRSEIVLISIGEGAGGGGGGRKGGPPKNCLNRNIIWRYHRNERAFPTTCSRQRQRQVREYNENYLANSTALFYDLHDPGFFSASDGDRAFYDRFSLLLSTFPVLAVRVRGGLQESRGHRYLG